MENTVTIKRFLLISGANYYPSHDVGDWKGFYNTQEDALKDVEKVGDMYRIKGSEYLDDWYEIIDMKNYSCEDL